PVARVSTSVVLACTSTVSETCPTSSLTLMTGLLPTASTIPFCTYVRNPGNVPSSLYGPIGKFASTYAPVSLVTGDGVWPFCVWVAVISTPGSIAPLWSATDPLICAVSCAHASALRNIRIVNALNQCLTVFLPRRRCPRRQSSLDARANATELHHIP